MENVIETAANVTTPLGLLGLVAALAFYIYRQKLINDRSKFQSISKDEKAKIADTWLSRYKLSGQGLSKEQKFALINSELTKRTQTSRLIIICLFVTFIVCFIISAFTYLLSNKGNPNDGNQTSTTPCTYPKIKFAILRSDNDYSRSINTAFLNKITSLLPYKHKKCVEVYEKIGSNAPFDTLSIRTEYYNIIDNITQRGNFDFYISVGTSSARAFYEYFNAHPEKKGNKKFVFLGVSDPVSLGLALTLKNRKENTNWTGIAYAHDYEDLPAIISRLYPNRKIIYIYNRKYLQDSQIEASIAKSPLSKDSPHSGKILSILPLNRQPELKDFIDTSAVYFSWMTFELMFENQGLDIFRRFHVVSTTQTHTEHGFVPFAISTSDKEIGELGADLISEILLEPDKSLGRFDIKYPKWRVYSNCRKAEEKKIPIEIIEKNADERYECR